MEKSSSIINDSDFKTLDHFGIEKNPSEIYSILEDISRRAVKYGVWYLSGLPEEMKIKVENIIHNLVDDSGDLEGYVASMCRKHYKIKKRILDFYENYKEEIKDKQGEFRLNSCLGLSYKDLFFINHLEGYRDFISILEDNLDGFRDIWNKDI